MQRRTAASGKGRALALLIGSLVSAGLVPTGLVSAAGLEASVEVYHETLEMLAQDHPDPKIRRAVAALKGISLDLLTDPELRGIYLRAGASTKGATAAKKTAILAARKQLQQRGLLGKIKNRRLYRALGYINKERAIFQRLSDEADAASKAFGTKKQIAWKRACIATMKVLSGAYEMFNLDHNRELEGATEALIPSMTKNGYIKPTFSTHCRAAERIPDHHGEGRFSCVVHGTVEQPLDPPMPLDAEALAQVEEKNSLYKAMLRSIPGGGSESTPARRTAQPITFRSAAPASSTEIIDPITGKPLAQIGSGSGQGTGQGNADPVRRQRLTSSAQAGDTSAQLELGKWLRYERAPANIHNWREGRRWLKEAMDSGSAEATYLLANAAEPPLKEDPVPHDRWRERLKLAASRGHPQAMYELGYFHLQRSPRSRRGFDEDKAAGADYLRRAAEAGLPQAMYEYAWSLALGEGVAKDRAAHKMWLSRAADNGHEEALRKLGRLNDGGKYYPLAGIRPSHPASSQEVSGFWKR